MGMGSLSHPIPPESLSSGRAGAPRGCLGNPEAGLTCPGWPLNCGTEPRYPSNCGRKTWSDPRDEGPFRRECPPDVGARAEQLSRGAQSSKMP